MPARATESASGFRRYRWGGREFTSVTTILGNGVPKQGPLVPWAAKAVAQTAIAELPKLTRLVEEDGPNGDEAERWLKGAHYRLKKAAGLKGTEIHELAEAHAKGLSLPPVSPAAVAYVQPLMDFLNDWKPDPILTEETAFSLKHGYAGTFDSICKFPDVAGIKLGTRMMDFKTSKGVYGETAMQLAAYAHADFWDDGGKEGEIPPLDGGLVVHISPTGYALFLADISEDIFQCFLAVKEVARFQTDVSKHVLTSI